MSFLWLLFALTVNAQASTNYDEALSKAQEAFVKQTGLDRDIYNIQLYIVNKTHLQEEVIVLGTVYKIYKTQSIIIPLNKNYKLQMNNNGANIIIIL